MTSDYKFNSPVHITGCDSYDTDLLCSILRESFAVLGITDDLIRGKKVCLKPNLVLAKKPEYAATTHPAFVSAAARVLAEMGAEDIVLADSPGGPYNAANLGNVYRVCEMNSAQSEKLRLNDDFTFTDALAGGVKLKKFHIISAVQNADVIVDLCKLKTHSLTRLSCATKNLFGIIPGVEKFEMHSTYPEIADFSEMLVDLSSYVLENKTFIALCDAVLSMEGNGPTHGVPKKTGMILVSRSPYSLDVIGECIIGAVGETVHLDCASKRGFMPRDYKDIDVIGMTDYPTFEFVRPDADAGYILKNLPNLFGGRLAKMFETKPDINLKKCVGCGICSSSCPRHTITIENKKSKKYAKIDRSDCIRCFCCQELCPIGAVGIKQNFLIKLIH